MNETTRDAFEAWLRSIWTDGYACPKNNDGSYKDPAAQRFWQCWQAALLSAHSVPAPEIPEEVIREQEGLNHPATQVFFRAGLLACREYMARFVEHESPTIAASIRANWWPTLGQDFGAPRKLEWSELTEGEYGEEGFRAKTADEISPTQEALPIALQFLLSLDPGYRRATIDMGMERSIKRELDASPYPPQAVVTLPALTANECAIAAPTAPAVVPLTPMERSVVCALMSVAHDAFYALDDAEESKAEAALGESYHVLCSALDVLDEFPDDKPGYTLDGPGRARWALRRLLGDNYEPKNAEPCNASPAQAEQQDYIQYSDELTPRTAGEKAAYLEGIEEGRMRERRDSKPEQHRALSEHAARDLLPNALWTRHGSGEFEWWSFNGYECRKDGAGQWVVRKAGNELYRHTYLQVVMAHAERAILAASSPECGSGEAGEIAALDQLRKFVDAKRFDLEVFPDQMSFGDWVVSRSRAVLSAHNRGKNE
jgi:hypothetical protein